MSATSWLNGAAALAAVVLAAAVGGGYRAMDRAAAAPIDGDREIADASGHVTRVRDFRRIVSGSALADRLLLELCEPDRVVALSAYGAAHAPINWPYAGKKWIEVGDVEAILALKPDLVITHSFGMPAKLARLREAGVQVFDLGEARGLDTLLANARMIGALVGHRERGERWAASFARRFERIAADVPAASRKRAIYLAVYNSQFFGASTGSSYHDVLTHAGLIDAAADHYTGWPQYSAEQVLLLDPEVIVTKTGMRDAICAQSLLSRLAACRTHHVIELAADWLDDPGPAMQDVAEQIAAAIYSP